MGEAQAPIAQGETVVTVRYWAAARAAAGVGEDRIATDGPLTLAEVRVRALALHPEAGRPAAGDRVLLGAGRGHPVGRRDPAEVTVRPGASVEFLPPFAGG